MDLEAGTRMNAEECIVVQYETWIEKPGEYLKHIHEIEDRFGTVIILFNSDLMAGRRHVRSALHHAFLAFREGNSISHSPEMEALLYASASRQCNVGAQFGVHEGNNRVYLCLCPGSRPALDLMLRNGQLVSENWDVFTPEKTARLVDVFGISRQELEVTGLEKIPDLVLERVALLEVQR